MPSVLAVLDTCKVRIERVDDSDYFEAGLCGSRIIVSYQ